MANLFKILGQVAIASANVEENLYTTPAATQTVVSTLTVVNRGTTVQTFRVALRPSADGATTAKHYIYYDLPVPPKDSFRATCGDTLATGDKFRVEASSTDVSFTVTGQEST